MTSTEHQRALTRPDAIAPSMRISLKFGAFFGIALASIAFVHCGDDEGTGAGGSGATSGGGGGAGGSGAAGGDGPSCTDDALAMSDCVDQAAYEADLAFIAQPRDQGTAHWQAVQDLCAERFEQYGFTVERQSFDGDGVNVIGVKAGTSTKEVLIGAHYDSTDASCNGADDNATGTAGVLESARILSAFDFEHTLTVACWDKEEDGLVGSEAWVDRAVANGQEIEVYYNYEMIGYYDETPDSQTLPTGFNLVFPQVHADMEANDWKGDFIAIINDEDSSAGATALMEAASALDLKAFQLELSAALKNAPNLADLRRSDHAPFWENDYPAMMITDTSEFRYENYHCINGPDDMVNLDHTLTAKVIAATTYAAVTSLGTP